MMNSQDFPCGCPIRYEESQAIPQLQKITDEITQLYNGEYADVVREIVQSIMMMVKFVRNAVTVTNHPGTILLDRTTPRGRLVGFRLNAIIADLIVLINFTAIKAPVTRAILQTKAFMDQIGVECTNWPVIVEQISAPIYYEHAYAPIECVDVNDNHIIQPAGVINEDGEDTHWRKYMGMMIPEVDDNPMSDEYIAMADQLSHTRSYISESEPAPKRPRYH